MGGKQVERISSRKSSRKGILHLKYTKWTYNKKIHYKIRWINKDYSLSAAYAFANVAFGALKNSWNTSTETLTSWQRFMEETFVPLQKMLLPY